MKNAIASLLVMVLSGSMLVTGPAPGAVSLTPASHSLTESQGQPQSTDEMPSTQATPTPTPVPSNDPVAEPTVEEIVVKALEASARVGTLKSNMDMVMIMESTSVTVPGKITVATNATSIMDNEKKEMQMLMTMSMEGIPGLPKLDTQAEGYIIGEWMYMKMSVPQMGIQWVKVRVGEKEWKKQQRRSACWALKTLMVHPAM